MANTISAEGSAAVSVDPQEIEARLIFNPDSSGDMWDPPAIRKLLSDHNIGAPADPKILETFLQIAAKANRDQDTSPKEIVIAQGILPEEPQEEVVTWEDLPVLPDLQLFQAEALAAAEYPQFFKTKVERIRQEKKMVKPGILPFLPGKEEVAVTWARKESQEKVEVDPEVLEVKYADRGTLLGTVIPGKPGKPGKNIYGAPLLPQSSGEDNFFTGKGISREKTELRSQVSGFIRIGKNWADIIPLARPSYDITTGTDGITLLLYLEGGDQKFEAPRADDILEKAMEQGADQDVLISADELENAISEARSTGVPLEAYPLFRPLGAEARVDINDDRTRAALFLRKALAGAAALEMKTISKVLRDSGLRFSDPEKLKADIRTFMEGHELELRDYVLAEGFPARRGDDREITVQATGLTEDEKGHVLPRLRGWNHVSEGLSIDSESNYAFVQKGAVIAQISPISEGEAGKDIFGTVIPGLPGNDPDIKLYQGLVQQGANICASQNGLLIYKGEGSFFHGEVLEYQDARILIHLSEDAMIARGDFFREAGPGVPLTVENIQKVLNILGVTYGIDLKSVQGACHGAQTHGSVLGKVIAKGTPAVAPGGREASWHIALEEGKALQIKKGSPILDLSAPIAEGKSGFDVKSREISPQAGQPQSFDHDETIQMTEITGDSPNGGRRLIAARSGELLYDGQILKITSVRTIQGDAGPATGNIRFSGEVRISGNVLPGCAVIGGSHVIVDGQAQEALISAGGRAVARQGVKGGGRGIVRARTGIEAAFTERASLMALGDIQVQMGSILSTIKTNGKLLISKEGGKLSGGSCQARRGIDAVDIGSEKGQHTALSFGQDYLIKDQIDSCEEEISTVKQGLEKIDERIKEFKEKHLHLPDIVPQEKERLKKLLEQLSLKLFTLREKFEEHYQSEIRIRGTIFPGVVIESHGRYYEVQQKRSGVIFYFDTESGRIKEKPLA
ncbi:MAG: FapA family protein [Treponema sp.]|nr:FapA family protein [Treponema sp.]